MLTVLAGKDVVEIVNALLEKKMRVIRFMETEKEQTTI